MSSRFILAFCIVASMVFSPQVSAEDHVSKIWSMKPSKIAADRTAQVSTVEHRVVHNSSIVKLRGLPPQDSPDVQITTATNVTQSENSVFVSPLNPDVVLNSNNSSNYPVSTIYGASRYVSTDGGLTWTGSEQGAGGTNGGDPAAVIGLSGYFFINYIANDDGNGTARSTDGGATWTHVQVAPIPGPGGLADKNHMWIDNSPTSPYQGNLYAAWTDFGGPNENNIVLSRSTDAGLTWSPVINLSSAIAAGSHNQGVNIQTASNGDVYAAWAVYDAWPALEVALGFTKSTNGGATWAPATRIFPNIKGIRSQATGGGLLGGKDMRTASFPSMTVNRQNGNLFIAWTNIGVPGINTGTERDVYVSKSTDGGATWGTAVRINQDTFNNGKDQWFPWLASDPSTGGLVAVFYDSRDLAANDMANTYVAVSRDDGATWEDFKVSDVAWSGDGSGTGFSGNYAGDYIGIAVSTGKVYPVWTDRRATGARLSTWVSPILLADPTDPNPPTNVKAFSDFSMPTSMALSWTNPTTLANGTPIGPFVMRIKRNGVQITERPGTDTTYTDTGLTDGTLYTYTFQARLTATDSLSTEAQTSWIAGGSRIPSAPTGLTVSGTSATGYKVRWTNPSRQIDGTRLDDLAGVRLYRDGSFLTLLARTPADTARADSTTDSPPAGLHSYYVTVIDNEVPINESGQSNLGFTPLEIPFTDNFPVAGTPNSAIWVSTNVTVDDRGVNEPSDPYSMNFNGTPTGNGDTAATLSLDLSALQDSGVALSYWYQPRGTGENPEVADSLIVEFRNDLGQWIQARRFPGLAAADPTPPYQFDAIGVDGVNPGGGTFFYNGFRLRFRSKSTVGAFDDWFVDDVFFGIPSGTANIGVSAITSPVGQISNNAPVNPALTIVNSSAVQAGVFNVTVNITGPGTSYNATQSDSNIAAGASRAITFSSQFTPNAVGQWTVTAYTTLSGDPDPANDTLSSTFFVVNPITLPLTEAFADTGVPNPLVWTNRNATVNADGDNEPSAPYSLNLNGNPTGVGLDTVTTLTIDLSAMAGMGVKLAYWQQPTGTGDPPESADSLIVEALNNLGTWVLIKKIPGAANRPFTFEQFNMDSLSAGGGTFFHSGFKFRFRSRAQTGTTTPDDWFVDDVFFGIPTAAPQMVVSPLQISDTVLVGTIDSTSYSFDIRNNNPFAAPLTFSITEDPVASWISASPAGGSVTGGGSLTVGGRIDFTGVTPGTYATRFIVAGNDPSNTSDSVNVSFVVNASPVISVAPDSFFFALNGGDSATGSLYIRNSGLGPLTYTSSVSGGFAGQTPDDIGNAENNLATTSNLMRGGVVSVTTTVQLLEIKSWLNITTSRELRFIVYQNTAATGTFTKIFESVIPSSGTGTQFYSSGPVNITLQAGMFYAVGVDWNGGLTYYWDASAPVPIPISFGTITGGLAQTVFPPPATINQGASTSLYYTQLVTASGRWLSIQSGGSGTVAPGDSTPLGFKITTNLLPAGVASAALVVNSNDPVTATVNVPVVVDVVTALSEVEAGIPEVYGLDQNYPNPFNPVTRIRFALPKESTVRVTLYNILGQEVITLVDGQLPAGHHSRQWNGTNSSGHPVGTGVYFYRIEASATGDGETFTSLKKLVLLK